MSGVGRTAGRVSSTVHGRVWVRAREIAFVEEVADSPLAKRPYDLRHACVSMWLNAGVAPPRVAEWAGHSVRVLVEVYAKCLDSGESSRASESSKRCAERVRASYVAGRVSPDDSGYGRVHENDPLACLCRSGGRLGWCAG